MSGPFSDDKTQCLLSAGCSNRNGEGGSAKKSKPHTPAADSNWFTPLEGSAASGMAANGQSPAKDHASLRPVVDSALTRGFRSEKYRNLPQTRNGTSFSPLYPQASHLFGTRRSSKGDNADVSSTGTVAYQNSHRGDKQTPCTSSSSKWNGLSFCFRRFRVESSSSSPCPQHPAVHPESSEAFQGCASDSPHELTRFSRRRQSPGFRQAPGRSIPRPLCQITRSARSAPVLFGDASMVMLPPVDPRIQNARPRRRSSAYTGFSAISSYPNVNSQSDKVRILVLLSDTGGGHRASAAALQDALEYLYGENVMDITALDLWTEYGCWPFNSFISVYRFASENPWCWKLMYESSRSPISRSLFLSSGYAVSSSNFCRVFAELQPDLVISVHPLCQHVPLQIMAELQANGEAVMPPFVTVVTDLGGAHPTWFHPKATRIYVPSDAVRSAALAEGVSESQLRQFGLPLRRAFWQVPSQTKQEIRMDMNFLDWPTVLLVGGGEGVGKLDEIAAAMAKVFGESDKSIVKTVKQAIHHMQTDVLKSNAQRRMQLVVICGKNESTRNNVLAELRAAAAKYPNGFMVVDDRSETYEGPGQVVGARPRAMSDSPVPQNMAHSPAEEKLVLQIPTRFPEDEEQEHKGQAPDRKTALARDTRDMRTCKSAVKDIAERGEFLKGESIVCQRGGACSPTNPAATTAAAINAVGQQFHSMYRRRSLSEDTHKMKQVLAKFQESMEQMVIDTQQTVPPSAFVEPELIRSTENGPFPDNCRFHAVVYGFTKVMDKLMAVSDLVVTKAGPGTIAEATTRGLPVLLSAYLPGQEEGNVSYVLDNEFGTYCTDPKWIALITREWLTNPNFNIKLKNMMTRSRRVSNPTASIDIAHSLGELLNLRPIPGRYEEISGKPGRRTTKSPFPQLL